MTIKQIIAFIILVPVTVVLIAFIIANRAPTRLAFNPLNPDEAAFSFTAPFFVWLFLFLAIGILVGGVITWFTKRQHQKAAHVYQEKLRSCHAELLKK